MGTFDYRMSPTEDGHWARSPYRGNKHLDADSEDRRWAEHDDVPTEFEPDREFPPGTSSFGPVVSSYELYAGGDDAEEVEWRLAELREYSRQHPGALWGGNS